MADQAITAALLAPISLVDKAEDRGGEVEANAVAGGGGYEFSSMNLQTVVVQAAGPQEAHSSS